MKRITQLSNCKSNNYTLLTEKRTKKKHKNAKDIKTFHTFVQNYQEY